MGCSARVTTGGVDRLTLRQTNINMEMKEEMNHACPRDRATSEVAASGVEWLGVGNDPKVAGRTGKVRLGGRILAGVTGSIGLVGDGGSAGEEAAAGAFCTLLEPSTRSSTLTAELRKTHSARRMGEIGEVAEVGRVVTPR